MVSILPFLTYAQKRVHVTGHVSDKITGESLPYVSVQVKGTTIGDMTDNKGRFEFYTTDDKIISASCIGYENEEIKVSDLFDGFALIRMQPSTYELNEVYVKPTKEKYSRKGNPAVELLKKVLVQKDINSPKNKEFYNYERYEKLTCAINNFDHRYLDNKYLKKLDFIKNYVDTSLISGKPILNISIKETIEQNYIRYKDNKHKRVVEAYKHDGLDEMLPQESIQEVIKEVFREVDIYEEGIMLFTNEFISPISSKGINFYKHYILDTLMIDGKEYIDLGFVPVVSESFGFTGHAYIANDSTYFIKKIKLNLPKDININFINSMQINQEFEKSADGTRLITKDDVICEIQIVKGTPAVYARRLNSYSRHSFDEPGDKNIFKKGGETTIIDGAHLKNDNYWQVRRHVAVDGKEDTAKQLLEELRSVPVFYYSEKILSWLFMGYVPVNGPESKFLYGPINTTISSNPLEGVRLRTGGLTTSYLNKRMFGYGYLAYGTKDEKFKYLGQLEYSFHNKKEHANEFPIHSIRAYYNYDIDQLGQEYATNKDNFLLSLKRGDDDLITYLRKVQVSYQREHYSGLSYSLALNHKTEYSTRFVRFERINPDETLSYIPSYQMAQAEFKIRYARNEKFFQTKTKRYSITPQVPAFSLSHVTAKKGILGTEYNYNRTEFQFDKRFWVSPFGYIDTNLKAGKVWDKVPYTLLCLPNSNLSYTIQEGCYTLLNPVEFVNDQYASINTTYFLNAALFNLIPVIKRLKWREVLTFKGLIGSLSDKNNPQYNNELFVFPEHTRLMGKTPYMEAGVGIENILKVLRVDYTWRLTYRDAPNINKSGVSVSMHITF